MQGYGKMKDWNAAAADLYDGGLRRKFIGVKWCDADSGEVIEAQNPADGGLLATVPRGRAADIDAAVSAARRRKSSARASPTCRSTPSTRWWSGPTPRLTASRRGGSTHLGMAHRLKAGSVWLNMHNAIDPAVPFGGIKMSGYGREGGTEHMEEYLDTKAIWINAE